MSPALKEYEAQDRRMHELLEEIRTASYERAQRAVGSENWHHANALTAANDHLANALRAVLGQS